MVSFPDPDKVNKADTEATEDTPDSDKDPQRSTSPPTLPEYCPARRRPYRPAPPPVLRPNSQRYNVYEIPDSQEDAIFPLMQPRYRMDQPRDESWVTKGKVKDEPSAGGDTGHDNDDKEGTGGDDTKVSTDNDIGKNTKLDTDDTDDDIEDDDSTGDYTDTDDTAASENEDDRRPRGSLARKK